MKTDPARSKGASEKVKTQALPFLSRIRGKYWYFRHGELHIPLRGEHLSEEFMAHYYGLMQIHGLFEQEDDRTVYFVGWRGGPVKIGVTANITMRLRRLQQACPYPLMVHAQAPGGRMLELEYHSDFRAHRLCGEWFEWCPEIEAEICRLQESIQ